MKMMDIINKSLALEGYDSLISDGNFGPIAKSRTKIFRTNLPNDISTEESFLGEELEKLMDEAKTDLAIAQEAIDEGRRYIMTDTIQVSLEGYMDMLDTKYSSFGIAVEDSDSSNKEGNVVVRFFKAIINFFYRFFKAILDKLASLFGFKKKNKDKEDLKKLEDMHRKLNKEFQDRMKQIFEKYKASDITQEVKKEAEVRTDKFYPTEEVTIEYPRNFFNFGDVADTAVLIKDTETIVKVSASYILLLANMDRNIKEIMHNGKQYLNMVSNLQEGTEEMLKIVGQFFESVEKGAGVKLVSNGKPINNKAMSYGQRHVNITAGIVNYEGKDTPCYLNATTSELGKTLEKGSIKLKLQDLLKINESLKTLLEYSIKNSQAVEDIKKSGDATVEEFKMEVEKMMNHPEIAEINKEADFIKEDMKLFTETIQGTVKSVGVVLMYQNHITEFLKALCSSAAKKVSDNLDILEKLAKAPESK